MVDEIASLDDGALEQALRTVFVSDPTVEAERLSEVLRTSGYFVVDVPLATLVPRAAVQRPRVVLLDADSDGAFEAAAKLRALPGDEPMDVVFLGREREIDLEDTEGAAYFPRPLDVSALLALLERYTGGPERPMRPPSMPPPVLPPVSAALGPPSSMTGGLTATALPPPSMRMGDGNSSRPPPSRAASSVIPLAPPPALAGPRSTRSGGFQAPLSAELEALLKEAEERAFAQPSPESTPPSPEDEVEAVLPAEILASLDEPIAADEDDEGEAAVSRVPSRAAPEGRFSHRAQPSVSSHPAWPVPSDSSASSLQETHAGPLGAPTTGAAAHGSGERFDDDDRSAPFRTMAYGDRLDALETNGARPSVSPGNALTQHGIGADVAATAPPPAPATTASAAPPRGLSAAPPRPASSLPQSPSSLPQSPSSLPQSPSSLPASPVLASQSSGPEARRSGAPELLRLLTASRPPSVSAPSSLSTSSLSAPTPDAPVVFSVGDAAQRLGRAIAFRETATLSFEAEGVARRVVVRDGDLVTASSSAEDEALVPFLVARGDLPRDSVRRLAGRVPSQGRHAGAALVAHGLLRQDQLWDVLRGHAEWIVGRVVLAERGTVQLLEEPPGRLRGEPGVFGAATGAAAFVDIVRRVVTPERAVQWMGGAGVRIGGGTNPALVGECGLEPEIERAVEGARGRSLGQVLAGDLGADCVVVVFALMQLDVLARVSALGLAPSPTLPPDGDDEAARLEEEAIRARVRARMQLVEEGDYFSILGLTPDATGYEIRRAYLELRRSFEPARLLTPRVLDLEPDVRTIVLVLEEAYEILRDAARRERYRRAITAVPTEPEA